MLLSNIRRKEKINNKEYFSNSGENPPAPLKGV
jgi:hypothetical protein